MAVIQTRALRHSILRPHEQLAQLAAAEPPGSFAVGAFADAQLIAVGLVAPSAERGDWRVRGMATDARVRGRGIGACVLDRLLAHASAEGAARIWCNARTPARSFYERAGFLAASAVFELPRIGPHVVMERGPLPLDPPPPHSR